jgi:superfamily I DNA and/or RNA helicase
MTGAMGSRPRREVNKMAQIQINMERDIYSRIVICDVPKEAQISVVRDGDCRRIKIGELDILFFDKEG